MIDNSTKVILDGFETKHVPRVSPYSPASIDPGFVESASYSSRNEYKKIHTDRHTDELNNGTLYAPRYEEALLPKGK